MKFFITDPQGNKIEIDIVSPTGVRVVPCIGDRCPFYRQRGCMATTCIVHFPATSEPVKEHEVEQTNE